MVFSLWEWEKEPLVTEESGAADICECVAQELELARTLLASVEMYLLADPNVERGRSMVIDVVSEAFGVEIQQILYN